MAATAEGSPPRLQLTNSPAKSRTAASARNTFSVDVGGGCGGGGISAASRLPPDRNGGIGVHTLTRERARRRAGCGPALTTSVGH